MCYNITIHVLNLEIRQRGQYNSMCYVIHVLNLEVMQIGEYNSMCYRIIHALNQEIIQRDQ